MPWRLFFTLFQLLNHLSASLSLGCPNVGKSLIIEWKNNHSVTDEAGALLELLLQQLQQQPETTLPTVLCSRFPYGTGKTGFRLTVKGWNSDSASADEQRQVARSALHRLRVLLRERYEVKSQAVLQQLVAAREQILGASAASKLVSARVKDD